MAGMLMTITETRAELRRAGQPKRIRVAWTSDDAAGTASGTTVLPYRGKIIGLATVPGAGGEQPTDQYDLTIADADGLDVLAGAGANQSNAAAVYEVDPAALGHVIDSKLTFAIAAAGNAKTGEIFLDIL
jgi:hypothetical protein